MGQMQRDGTGTAAVSSKRPKAMREPMTKLQNTLR